MKLLRKTEFGNPILRQVQKKLTAEEVLSDEIQELIADMRYTVEKKRFGVGLAAPQVGRELALSVIAIKPTPTRKNAIRHDMVIINPEIIKTYGNKKPMWEGCISGTQLFAQVPRYRKIRLKYTDEQGKEHEADYEGLVAHVIQHEVDHLNGILFVDKVKDTKSYSTFKEYIRKLKEQEAKK